MRRLARDRDQTRGAPLPKSLGAGVAGLGSGPSSGFRARGLGPGPRARDQAESRRPAGTSFRVWTMSARFVKRIDELVLAGAGAGAPTYRSAGVVRYLSPRDR